jgi:short chain dehydrogenase
VRDLDAQGDSDPPVARCSQVANRGLGAKRVVGADRLQRGMLVASATRTFDQQHGNVDLNEPVEDIRCVRAGKGGCYQQSDRAASISADLSVTTPEEIAGIVQGSGKIINLASTLSFEGGLIVPSYTASKHGVAGITKALANEWASAGVNVNAVAPGYIATDNTAPLRADAERSQSILSRIPAARWGTPNRRGRNGSLPSRPSVEPSQRRNNPSRRRLANPLGTLWVGTLSLQSPHPQAWVMPDGGRLLRHQQAGVRRGRSQVHPPR